MPIDASIYGETKLFQPTTPTQAAAQLGVFQEVAQHIKDQKQQELDQTAMQQAVQQTGGDYEKAIASLNAAGRVSAAQSLQGAWDKHQEAAGKALEAHLKAQDAQLGYYSHLANLINDDASQKAVLATLSPEDQQRVSPLLGETFDPQRVSSIRDVMLDSQKRAQIQHEALQDWLASGKTTQEGVTTLAKYLSATPQPQWGQVLSSAKSLGIPQASLDFVTQNVTTPEQADAIANKKEESDKLQSPEVEAIKAWSREHGGAQPTQKDLEQIHRGFKEAGTIVRVTGANGGAGASDAKSIAQAIISGDQPPDMKGLYRFTGPVRAELARQGYNLTKASEDWQATQKYLGTLNGAQQTRLRQAVEFTRESLPLVQNLVTEWDSAGLPVLSKANLDAAASGAYGSKQQSLAVRLKAQIADLTSELGTVYKGGNSSTDESLKLAAQNLQGNWSKQAALDALKQIDTNLTIRANSIRNTGPIANEGNPYAPQTVAPSGGGPKIGERRKFGNQIGEWDGKGWKAVQ